jgi:hypothetical protein
VRTKPRNVYDIGQGVGSHDAGAPYHECEPLVLTTGNLYDMNDEFEHNRHDIDPIEATVECINIICSYNSLKFNYKICNI